MSMKQKKRSEISDEFKWSVNDLVASQQLWDSEYERLSAESSNIIKYKNTFSEGSQNLLACLKERDTVGEVLGRIYVYAQLKLTEDSTDAANQAIADRAEMLLINYYSACSFIEPEIIGLGKEKILSYIAENKDLKIYEHYLSDILRQEKHILSPEVEELLSKTQELSQAPENIFSMINNADMKFGFVKDENGIETELTQGRYTSFLESSNREVRKEAFEKFYAAYISQKNTLAATYSASVKSDIFYGQQRKYASALEGALSSFNIDVSVYKNLIKTVEKHLPSLHKYVDIRKKALELDEIHMYDLYTPIVENANKEVSYEEAKNTVLKALRPLGEDYVNTVKEGFDTGWIDVYENEGKRSGAFSWGSYGCHPFVLLNYDNKLNDMFTLAHEMGHAMHSHYTWSNQPHIYGDYTIFVAEVASTVNEALLMEYLLKNTEDENMRKYLINYYMEQFRGTLFRQTMFAEFEMLTHEMAERGEALTVESLNTLYRELNRKYYGENIVLDEEIDYEWARIPHFYSAFYVYQYATGYSAAIALSKGILEKGDTAVSDYLSFLKGGSSDYSINLLKKAGVDMSRPEPVDSALNVFAALVDEFENYIK